MLTGLTGTLVTPDSPEYGGAHNHEAFSTGDPLKTYYGNNVEQLKCVKKKYDPDNLFRYEQSVPPECKQ